MSRVKTKHSGRIERAGGLKALSHASGESDYTDYMGRIDGRIYCQSCYDDKMDAIENAIIEECFLQNNFDLSGNRR